MCLSRGFYKYFYFEENLSLCRKINGISQMILYLHRRDRARPCPNLLYIPLRTAARAVPTASSFAPYRSQQPLVFLTHYATPPFPQKSRSARLLGCKRPPDGSLSLPTFADFSAGASPRPTDILGQPQQRIKTKRHPKGISLHFVDIRL